jgi:hypothetical protein
MVRPTQRANFGAAGKGGFLAITPVAVAQLAHCPHVGAQEEAEVCVTYFCQAGQF